MRGGAALTGALALAAAITVQAVLGIVTLLYQMPLALALGHQAMAIVVLTIAVVHAQRLERRSARARGSAPTPLRRQRSGDMIELTSSGDIAVLRMAHGKANA